MVTPDPPCTRSIGTEQDGTPPAVEEYVAGAAQADSASVLDAFEAEVVPQQSQQGRVGRDVGLDPSSVKKKFNHER